MCIELATYHDTNPPELSTILAVTPQQIAQSSRCCDYYVWSRIQLFRLAEGIHPTDNGDRPQAHRTSNNEELFGELIGQLSDSASAIDSSLKSSADLVGVRTTAKTPKGSLAIRSKMGKAKAKVLPLPVCAPPMQSRPDAKVSTL